MYGRWAKAYPVFYGLAGQSDPWDVSYAATTGKEGERGLPSRPITPEGSPGA